MVCGENTAGGNLPERKTPKLPYRTHSRILYYRGRALVHCMQIQRVLMANTLARFCQWRFSAVRNGSFGSRYAGGKGMERPRDHVRVKRIDVQAAAVANVVPPHPCILIIVPESNRKKLGKKEERGGKNATKTATPMKIVRGGGLFSNLSSPGGQSC